MRTVQFPKPLSKEKEIRVFRQMENGSEKEKKQAKNTLIEHNIRLVIFIANRFKSPRYELDDLRSIGTIGLIKAVNTFESDKNIKFATYASRCIQNEILMHLRKTKKTQKEVSVEEMLTRDSEGNQLSILDIIGTKKEEIEEEVQDQDTLATIKQLMEVLDPDEKAILCYRFGIGTTKKKQKEIAEMLDISQSYVSRLERKALHKVKNLYERKEKRLFV